MSVTTAHSSPRKASDPAHTISLQRQRAQLQALRIVIGCAALWFISRTVELGTDFFILALSLSVGIVLAGVLLAQGFSLLKLLLGHAIAAGGLALLLDFANKVTLGATSGSVSDFIVPLLGQHLWLCFGLYALGFFATWLFWTREHVLTLESLFGVGIVVWLLSAHRNYRLDAPKEIASLTWKLNIFQQWGVEPQHLFLAIGVLTAMLFIWYVGVAAFRPLYNKQRVIETKVRPDYLQLMFSGATGLAILFALIWFVNDWYGRNIARASNGVGPSAELTEGESNLGFNSAVTATKQPAAIVRLEADYKQNPNEPMLYLREGALSQFVGRELVKGDQRYNTDVPAVGLGQVFVAANPPQGAEYRTPIPQSVYIISSHQAPFAIDGVKQLRPLKNPNANRFQHAYQALSLAPTRPLQELVNAQVGSASWDDATWDHYLRAPGSLSDQGVPSLPWQELDEAEYKDSHGEDLRYGMLAKQLTAGETNKVIQAAMIIRFLSEKSIYTRSPGHDVSQDGDPTAPYLFAEKMRGYCVHFAHAAVYMFRLLGIPARIATGYQTDTRYAKDGHILLMLGDRHAWPEIYLEGRGWTVFDIAPQQAENEPELVPDENLLEQLMSELDPAPEFLDSDTSGLAEKHTPLDRRILAGMVLAVLCTLLLAVALRKYFLYYGYRFTSDSAIRAKRAYTAFAARMADSGISRYEGETRLEFCARLATQTKIQATQLAHFVEESVYPSAPREHSKAKVEQVLREVQKQRKAAFRWYQQLFAMFSLSSILRARSL